MESDDSFAFDNESSYRPAHSAVKCGGLKPPVLLFWNSIWFNDTRLAGVCRLTPDISGREADKLLHSKTLREVAKRLA
jgi:hypothetical protein